MELWRSWCARRSEKPKDWIRFPGVPLLDVKYVVIFTSMKRCSKCKEEKVDSEFYSRTDRPKEQLQPYCKQCCALRHREYYLKNKSYYREKATASRQKIVDFVYEQKTRPCHDCGIQYPGYIMDFDHRQGAGKVGNVSRLARNKSLEAVQNEIAKCDVVCANCHRERTHKRRTVAMV